jgi:hypothetical protein
VSERLEAAGWQVGSAKDFLGLTPEETAFVELKLNLGREFERTATTPRGRVKTQLVTWSNMNFDAKDAKECARERKEGFALRPLR